MKNKTAVVTGGNRGIGLSITASFIRAGYNVIVGARTDTGIEKKFDGKAKFVKLDVRNEEDHLKAVSEALELGGKLDVYVNNAGFSEWRPIDEIDNNFFDNMIGTNLKGAFWGCKAAAKNMTGDGAIINISSIAGKRGSTNNSMYCASKFGINGLTQALAKELGPRGIRVNAVCPVLVKTDGLVEALQTPHGPAKDGIDEFLRKFTQANSALGRLPKGEEVGAMCVFLASQAASAVTAQCINVDCGVFPQ